jgi:hypothetical protein
MLAFLLAAAALQPPTDFVALDEAHEAWARCAVAGAVRLSPHPQGDEAALTGGYAACAAEERAMRTVLARLHPEASPADIEDVVDRFRRRHVDVLIRAAVARAQGR